MDSTLRITAVDPDPRRPDAVRVEIDGARFGAVPRELASAEGLAVGRVVDPALQERLAGAADAEAAYRTVLRALEESEGSLVTYDRAHARLAILESAVRSSARAADLAQQRFEAGLTDFLQVLDAERTLLDAENQLAQGHTAAATALVAVYKAVGGTWPIK